MRTSLGRLAAGVTIGGVGGGADRRLRGVGMAESDEACGVPAPGVRSALVDM
jgi:hypothetical protein